MAFLTMGQRRGNCGILDAGLACFRLQTSSRRKVQLTQVVDHCHSLDKDINFLTASGNENSLSDPIAMSSQSYAATATPLPLLLPAGDWWPSALGFQGAWKSMHSRGSSVAANAASLVVPTTRAPNSRRCVMHLAVAVRAGYVSR